MLEDYEDDGTMPNNVAALENAVVGHRIVQVERTVPEPEYNWYRENGGVTLTLDNGSKVVLRDTDDCCAYTHLDNVITHLDTIDHIITNVTADEDYDTWHIFADLGEVLELQIGWSAGNPFYYGYGFDIDIIELKD